MAGYALLLTWTLVTSVALFTNRDIFSPAKIYLLMLFVFFGSIFMMPYSASIVAIYVGLLVVGLVAALFEADLPQLRGCQSVQRLTPRQVRCVTVGLWVVSAIPIAAQLYMFHLMGGIENYINTLGMRVIEHRGLGPILTVLQTYPIINVVYFSIGILQKRLRPSWWIGFLAHLSFFAILGLLSASRGYLLMHVLTLLMLWHHLRRPIRLKTAFLAGLALLACACTLEIARTGYRVTQYGFETGFAQSESSWFKTRSIEYGLIPLDLVMAREPGNPRLGMTYLTVFTNVVPRAIWPGKPDTGGVILTKEYTGDAWDGASNLSTGIIAESVINFGRAPGCIVGMLLMLFFLRWTLSYYRRMRANVAKGITILNFAKVVSCVFVMLAVASLTTGEFTSVVILLFVKKLIPLWALVWYVRLLCELSRSSTLSSNATLRGLPARV